MSGFSLLRRQGNGRATYQGGQVRDQVDAPLMHEVRRQRGAASASHVVLQSRQLPVNAGDAGNDRDVVADQPAEADDQERRASRALSTLHHLPDGRRGVAPEGVRGRAQPDKRAARATCQYGSRMTNLTGQLDQLRSSDWIGAPGILRKCDRHRSNASVSRAMPARRLQMQRIAHRLGLFTRRQSAYHRLQDADGKSVLKQWFDFPGPVR